MARALSRGISEHRRRRDARPLLSRQRREVDSRAGSRARHSLAGQLLLLARTEGEASRARRTRARSAAQDARTRARVGATESEGPPGQEQGASATLRRAAVAGISGAQ